MRFFEEEGGCGEGRKERRKKKRKMERVLKDVADTY
jgi:hypothetical protein